MINWKVRLLRPDSHKRVSGIPGVIQSEDEPFVYLNDIEPLKRLDVDIFKRNNTETSSAE
jgi:hypothetical protein